MDWPLVAALDPDLPVASLECSLVPPPKYDMVSDLAPPPEPLHTERDLQERQLIRDAFQLLAGCEGDHIQFTENFDPYTFDDRIRGPEYRFHPAIDSGARNILFRIAEIARFQYAVCTFVDHYAAREYGCVNNALSAALRVLTTDFVVQVAKVETATLSDPDFSLYKLWLHIHTFHEPLGDAYTVVSALQDGSGARRDLKVNDLAEFRAQEHFSDRALRQEEDPVVHDDHETIIDLRGGFVLYVIAELARKRGGNAQSRQLLQQLLKAASVPYLDMVAAWIYDGNLEDPWQDFLVRETKADRTRLQTEAAIDMFWEKRYELRQLELPLQFRESDIANKLVATGKFLNVFRECRLNDGEPPPESQKKGQLDEIEDIEDPKLLQAIHLAYDSANSRLLELLTTRFHLRQRLVSFNHYFFLDNGDFFPILLEMALPELTQPATEKAARRIQVLLDTALSHPNSASRHEPYVDECLANLAPVTLWEELLGVSEDEAQMVRPQMATIQALELDFRIEFPLSLVLTRIAIARYQFLFRLISEIKWTEKVLQNAWNEQGQLAQWTHPCVVGGKPLADFRRHARELRSRMSLCVGGLLYHMTVEIVQSNWRKFDKKLDTIVDVQQIGREHLKFLQDCLTGCFLTFPTMVKAQAELLAVCRDFGSFVTECSTSMAWIDPGMLNVKDRESLVPVYTQDKQAYKPADLLVDLNVHLGQFRSKFDLAVGELLDGIIASAGSTILETQLSALLARTS